jgi:hypothetical protein
MPGNVGYRESILDKGLYQGVQDFSANNNDRESLKKQINVMYDYFEKNKELTPEVTFERLDKASLFILKEKMRTHLGNWFLKEIEKDLTTKLDKLISIRDEANTKILENYEKQPLDKNMDKTIDFFMFKDSSLKNIGKFLNSEVIDFGFAREPIMVEQYNFIDNASNPTTLSNKINIYKLKTPPPSHPKGCHNKVQVAEPAAEKQNAPRQNRESQGLAKRESLAVADRCINKKTVNKKCINKYYTLLRNKNPIKTSSLSVSGQRPVQSIEEQTRHLWF